MNFLELFVQLHPAVQVTMLICGTACAVAFFYFAWGRL